MYWKRLGPTFTHRGLAWADLPLDVRAVIDAQDAQEPSGAFRHPIFYRWESADGDFTPMPPRIPVAPAGIDQSLVASVRQEFIAAQELALQVKAGPAAALRMANPHLQELAAAALTPAGSRT